METNPASESNEKMRLRALRALSVLDSDQDEQFDSLTALASHICNTPIALISLLDEQRKWFLSKVGLEATETPITEAFCLHAVARAEKEIFCVEDALKDPIFSQNPLVVGEPKIRSYISSPLVTPQQIPIGTLCVIDKQARTFDDSQRESLRLLAKQAVFLIEAKSKIRELSSIISDMHNLKGYWQVCFSCRRVKSDEKWIPLETFVQNHSDIKISHGVCTQCFSQNLSKSS